MGATLDALYRLQNIEIQLRSIRERIGSKARAIQVRRRRVAGIEREITDTHGHIQQAQAHADERELERQTHEDHISKLREALNQAKTNKEYAAILTQINTDKADALKLEDEVLTSLSQVDDLKKQEADLKASLETEQTALNTLEQDATDLETSLSGELADLESRRTQAAEKVPHEILTQFERTCEKREGEAMALVEKVHPKRAEYICTGCNMSVTLETVNALQSRDDVLQCQTCSRLLYLEAPAEVSA